MLIFSVRVNGCDKSKKFIELILHNEDINWKLCQEYCITMQNKMFIQFLCIICFIQCTYTTLLVILGKQL